MTCLFDYLELRGTDASGVWGTEHGKNGRVIYHKEPTRSSNFIKKDFWQKLRKVKLDMLLCHARAASKGINHAFSNGNNHPFVSSDKRIGMIHNGNIEEMCFLKEKYEVQSDTDSEILLRIFEHGLENNDISEIYQNLTDTPMHIMQRIAGIRDIWSYISYGAMAVALGERVSDNERFLFLFRNEKRPLWVADLREALGQIFFFSSPDIWYQAITDASRIVKELCSDTQKLMEVPDGEIWFFQLDHINKHISNMEQIQRFEVEVKDNKNWEYTGDQVKIKEPKVDLSVIVDKVKKSQATPILKKGYDIFGNPVKNNWTNTDHPWSPYKKEDQPVLNASQREDHEAICDQIIDVVSSIKTSITNRCIEGYFDNTPDSYQEIIEALEQTRADLQGTVHMVDGY